MTVVTTHDPGAAGAPCGHRGLLSRDVRGRRDGARTQRLPGRAPSAGHAARHAVVRPSTLVVFCFALPADTGRTTLHTEGFCRDRPHRARALTRMGAGAGARRVWTGRARAVRPSAIWLGKTIAVTLTFLSRGAARGSSRRSAPSRPAGRDRDVGGDARRHRHLRRRLAPGGDMASRRARELPCCRCSSFRLDPARHRRCRQRNSAEGERFSLLLSRALRRGLRGYFRGRPSSTS